MFSRIRISHKLKNAVKRYFKYFFLFQLVKGMIWLLIFFTGWSLFTQVKDSIIIHSGGETSGTQLGTQVQKTDKIFPEIKITLNILMLTLADGLLLGLIGVPFSIIVMAILLYCIGHSDSDSAEGLKDEELNVVERFWRDLDK